MLVIPGGYGTRPLLKHEGVLSWISRQASKVELLVSVCNGAWLLAAAGLLEGVEATTHHTAFDRLKELSPTTKVIGDRRFIQSSKNIATAAGISAGIDVSLHIVKEMAGKETHDKVVEEMEYNWGNQKSQ